MSASSVNKSCPYSPQSGPVGYLPAPNIFPLAKETFAKGKMFWNSMPICVPLVEIRPLKPKIIFETIFSILGGQMASDFCFFLRFLINDKSQSPL